MGSSFGQEVTLVVHNKAGGVTFDAAGLRVDFDVRIIDGFSRGTFTIYNLKGSTISNIANGENYVTVSTKLHSGEVFTVASGFFINNVLEEKVLPNSVTTLYCYDSIRKESLENQVDTSVLSPTLRKEMAAICESAGFRGEIVYKYFSAGQIDQASGRPNAEHSGSLQQCIRRLQKAYGFKMYTLSGKIVCMYVPSLDDVDKTDLANKAPDIVLSILNMRANPKLGPATLSITSILDGRIEPTSVLDISQLITVGVDLPEDTLQLAKEFLQDSVAGFSKYQVLTVQHKGSNYTGEWKTVATATSPTKGMSMPTLSWHKGT